MTRHPQATAFASLLADEHAALLRADFAALECMASQKEACAQALQAHPPKPDVLAHLHRLSTRNQVLLHAARDGLAMAMAALGALSEPRHATTYGPDGQRESLRAQHQALSRKF